MALHHGGYFVSQFFKTRFVFCVVYASRNQLTNTLEFLSIKATRRTSCRTNANTAGYKWRTLFIRDSVLVHGKANALQYLFSILARNVCCSKVYQAQMIIGTA